MESISAVLSQGHARRLPPVERSAPSLAQQLGQMKVDSFQKSTWAEDGTGIECPKCNNKGFVAFLREPNFSFCTRPCECYYLRKTMLRLKKIGLYEAARHCRLDNFITNSPHQQGMYATATRYLANPEGKWLAFLGQSGAGKTHLCTAVFVELSRRYGLAGGYCRWTDEIRAIKAAAMDAPDPLKPFKEAELLYIDDLFKRSQSEADLRNAFQILDYRSSKGLLTVLSSELTIQEILELDQAIGSRITAMCGPEYLCVIRRDPAKNFRLQGNATH